MVILRAGLHLSALVALYATWASREAGYAIEVAMLRGLVAFMAVIFVAYLAELVVLTAPPARRRPAATETERDGDPVDDEDHPVNLPTVRAEREVAADQRRAA